MSASREKKQRQGAGPSARELQAQQQTAAYKRKVRTYTAIGVVVVILVAALLIWNSGLFQRNQTAVTVGDTNYTVNDLSYYYYSLWNYDFGYYSFYGMSVPDADDVMDSESGQTYREYYLEQAVTSLTQLTALYDLAMENGYTEADVADTVQEQIDSMRSDASSSGYSYAAYLRAIYGRYMTTSAFESIISKAAVADAYYADYSDSLTYTDEEIQAYYDENKDTLDTYEYSYLYFTPEDVETTDEDGNELSDDEVAELEEAALAEAQDNAEHAVDQYNDGTSIADLAEEYELTSYGDHVTNVGSSVSSTYRETLAGYEDGQVGIYENGESGYYVLVLHERTLVETPNADVRHILIRAETTTDEDGNTVEPTDEAWDEALAKAEEILAEYEAGEQTEEAFTALAEEYSDDVDSEGNLNNDGLYSNISSASTIYVTEFMDWIFEEGPHNVGDTGIVRHEGDVDDSSAYWGYHIMYYAGDEDPVWKQTTVSALKDAELTEWMEELTGNYTASMTSAADYVAQ